MCLRSNYGLTEKKKNDICSLLQKMTQNVKCIKSYYDANLKDELEHAVNTNKLNSCLPLTEDHCKDIRIYKLQEIFEKYYSLHFDFLKTLEDFTNTKSNFDLEIENISLFKTKNKRLFDNYDNAFSFHYINDGDVGLINEYWENLILNIVSKNEEILDLIDRIEHRIMRVRVKKEAEYRKRTINEELLINQLFNASFKLQEDKTFYKETNNHNNSDLENKRNRQIRSILETKGEDYDYQVKDQTQRGLSQSGKSPGEVDLLIQKDGKTYALIEALNMDDTFNANYLTTHVDKLKNRYDQLGNNFNILLVYVDTKDFKSFNNAYETYLKGLSLDYKTKETEKSKSNCYITFDSGRKIYHLLVSFPIV